MGSGNVVLFVMIDLSAAFDTVDLAILLQTLNRLDIMGTAAAWFTSYLQHRKQSVKTASAKSPSTETKHGVPQGSVLGPILLLYTLPPSDISFDTMKSNFTAMQMTRNFGYHVSHSAYKRVSDAWKHASTISRNGWVIFDLK
jgi:hypothetical protein